MTSRANSNAIIALLIRGFLIEFLITVKNNKRGYYNRISDVKSIDDIAVSTRVGQYGFDYDFMPDINEQLITYFIDYGIDRRTTNFISRMIIEKMKEDFKNLNMTHNKRYTFRRLWRLRVNAIAPPDIMTT